MEEAKKMKCYKRLMYKQFVQVSGLCGPQFLSYWPKRFTRLCRAFSWSFVWRRYIGGSFWSTNMAAGNQKHLEFTFSIKALSFQSRTSIRVHKHILKYLKWVYCWKSRGEAFFNWTAFLFDVTHCENSEVQIAVFSKWNMLGEWKLAQRFTFCSSST